MLKTETSLETSSEMSSRSSQMSQNDDSRAKTMHRPTPIGGPSLASPCVSRHQSPCAGSAGFTTGQGCSTKLTKMALKLSYNC